ncbi:hypothetical protein HN018_07230 [Lichenicola cladoniae]|uniref:Uncharacterized protein n=1 Tax=Lichenicola cladoniae TaxID=1484109 RepID=A0A6M8HN64_9PROT|nr:hypothetical protein [Lichenicola cladoniae]NPD67366.1 hypothetical protein [Acetobacteraceae bacterium]QKE89863.1 hypothetical protein HN018_07230 [Lichenicola cladoniae]
MIDTRTRGGPDMSRSAAAIVRLNVGVAQLCKQERGRDPEASWSGPEESGVQARHVGLRSPPPGQPVPG